GFSRDWSSDVCSSDLGACRRLLDQEVLQVTAFAGVGGQPTGLLAASGPGVFRVGRIPVLRGDLAERLARLLGGGAARRTGGAGGERKSGVEAKRGGAR